MGQCMLQLQLFFLRKPHISFEDTFNQEQIRFYQPFTNYILTSDYDHPLKSDKVIRLAIYHELAYLHPNRFHPDELVLNELGICQNEKYVIMRFISGDATHDSGHKGINYEYKIRAIKTFEKFARVFISSEQELPLDLEKYCIKIPPSRMHHALAFSSLLFGESSTMAEEAAMLGVPSIYISSNSTYYTRHLEKEYGLVYNYSDSHIDQQKAIEKGLFLLTSKNSQLNFLKKRDVLISQKIDLTALLIWFVENFPQSAQLLKEKPDYQFNFK